jgi:signal peptidase II
MSHQQPGVRAILSLVGAVAAATALLDQVTKLLILRQFSPGEGVTVLPGLFDLTLLFNKGAAFGLFSRIESDVIRLGLLAITTIIALTVLFIVLLREYREDLWGQAIVGLVLGGAIGNVIDRVRIGAVVDFLDFHIGINHWPAFNVADSAICVGVFFLLIRKTKTSTDVVQAPDALQ